MIRPPKIAGKIPTPHEQAMLIEYALATVIVEREKLAFEKWRKAAMNPPKNQDENYKWYQVCLDRSRFNPQMNYRAKHAAEAYRTCPRTFEPTFPPHAHDLLHAAFDMAARRAEIAEMHPTMHFG